MDLDSRAQYKLVSIGYSDVNFEEYRRILEALCPLENPRILSVNGYITMFGKLIVRSDRVHGHPSNYIYCSVCDSLVFISENSRLNNFYQDSHLKRCISGNTISDKHVRINEILQSIDKREFQIWQYKQYILQEEAKLKHIQLELFSQSTPHSENDKLASISYDYNTRSIIYETYMQVKATIVKNTMPSTPNFEPVYILPARQEIVSPISHHVFNQKSEVLNGPTPPLLS
ncbi:hypothetical protein C1646_767718 [Rhizophagus diaphanus]|nr:hypothetical protein C1646_767718 [Rhizophagus diaphanus] [Rhizophagus sp. MUCL 43196]